MSRLLRAARIGLRYAEQEMALTIESNCRMRPDLSSRIETLDSDIRPIVDRQMADVAEIRKAIAEAEGDIGAPMFLMLVVTLALIGGVTVLAAL